MSIEHDEAGLTDAGSPALRRCVAINPATFASDYWGRRALLSRREDLPGTFADLFSTSDADELLSRRGLRTPFLRIAKQGRVVDSSSFTSGGGVGADIGDQARDDKVAELFAAGHTVVLQALHRTWPALIDFTTALRADLGHPVQINSYLTPAGAQGFSAHYDVHDVFVLQFAGTKRWQIHAPVHPDPLRSQPWTDHAGAVAAAARQQPLIDAELREGDALYVPRGFLHSAIALGGLSGHLTIGVHTLTRYAMVEALLSVLAEDPQLRTPLPLGVDVSDPAQLDGDLRAVVQRVSASLSDVDSQAMAAALRQRLWNGNRPEPLWPLAHAELINTAVAGTRVRLRSGVFHQLRTTPEWAHLKLADRTVSLPAVTAAAVTELLSGRACTVGELPGLDEADQTVVVRRLLREGVLVAADKGL